MRLCWNKNRYMTDKMLSYVLACGCKYPFESFQKKNKKGVLIDEYVNFKTTSYKKEDQMILIRYFTHQY